MRRPDRCPAQEICWACGWTKLPTQNAEGPASTEAKRKALEAVYDQVVSAELPEWNQDPDLLTWLTSL